MSEENLTDEPTDEPAGIKRVAARAFSAARTSLSAQAAIAAKATSAARAAWSGNAPAAPDDRDDSVARLEQEVAGEREKSNALAGRVKELEFQIEVLERSYSKQLADAREHSDAVEQEASQLKEALAQTKDELAEVTATRDRLREMMSFDGRRGPRASVPRGPNDNTVNQLLSADDWTDAEAQSRERQFGDKVRGEQERPAEELISPDLVFKADDEA